MSKNIGNYEIVEELGRGGMGVVYKAREESLQRFVAIKMLGSQLVDNESIAVRFMREARAVADLNHPNVVQVFRVDRHEDQPYFVMEYVEGESLKQLIRRENKLQPMRALQILKEVGNGLAAAHDKGVIHRDIKPENIMLTKYGGVKVVDFGIARVEEPGTRLTTTGMGLGTPSYISPEVCLSQDVDQRSDIFSMGVVLFEMLTGDIPFKSDSPFEMMTKVVEAKIPNIKELNPNVDDGLKQILAKMIAKRPKLRYQNCNELISDIEDYLAGRVPRWSKNMLLEENEASGTGEPAAAEVGEDTERPAGVDTSTPATTPMPQRPAMQADADESTATVAIESESQAESGRGWRIALAAMVLLLLAGGAVAGSWYLISGSERPLLAMFDSATDAGGTDVEQEVAGEVPRSSGQVSRAERPAASSSVASSNPDSESDASLDRIVSQPGESSGEALASVATPKPATGSAADSDAMPANPRIAVVAVGDASVAGTVAWEIKRALTGASFDVMDEQLVEGLVYAESLAAVARTVREAGASVLVYADVVPAGERELQFYGRSEPQYLARLEVRVVDLHTRRNLGPVASEKLEYVAMTADRKARETAAPVALNVANRLRALRAARGGASG